MTFWDRQKSIYTSSSGVNNCLLTIFQMEERRIRHIFYSGIKLEYMNCEENGSISYKPIFDVFINTKCNANDLHFLYLVID